MAQKTATYSAGVTAGTYTNADVTVSNQGVVTAIANGSAGSVTLAGDVTGPAGTNTLSNIGGQPLVVTYVAGPIFNGPTQTRQIVTTSFRAQNNGGPNLFHQFERYGEFITANIPVFQTQYDTFLIPAPFVGINWCAAVEIFVVGAISSTEGTGSCALSYQQAFQCTGLTTLSNLGTGSAQLLDGSGILSGATLQFSTTNSPQSINFLITTNGSTAQKAFKYRYKLIITQTAFP